jgi:hypothetical protein
MFITLCVVLTLAAACNQAATIVAAILINYFTPYVTSGLQLRLPQTVHALHTLLLVSYGKANVI